MPKSVKPVLVAVVLLFTASGCRQVNEKANIYLDEWAVLYDNPSEPFDTKADLWQPYKPGINLVTSIRKNTAWLRAKLPEKTKELKNPAIFLYDNVSIVSIYDGRNKLATMTRIIDGVLQQTYNHYVEFISGEPGFLYIQIHNNKSRFVGLRSPVGVGEYTDLLEMFLERNIRPLGLAVIYLMMGLFSVVVAFSRRSFRYLLPFGFLNLNMGVFLFIYNKIVQHFFLHDVLMHQMMVHTQLFLPLGIYSFYINLVTGRHVQIIKGIFYFHLAGALVLYFFSLPQIWYDLFYQLVFPVGFGLTLFFAVYTMIKNNMPVKALVAGLAIYGTSGMYDILVGTGIINSTEYMTPYGMLFLVIMMVFTIVDVFYRNEKTLKNYNRQLESEVRERTEELNRSVKHIKNDLKMASSLQRAVFPSETGSLGPIIWHAHFEPMSDVSGDMYSIQQLNQHTYRAIVADVTGHGVQSGLVVMVVKSFVESTFARIQDPAAMLNYLNEYYLKLFSDTGFFCTMIVADIDLRKKQLTYASAGHLSQFLLNKDGQESLKHTGPLLGFDHYKEYKQVTVDFTDSSRLLLFSDGLIEQRNQLGREFGFDNLLKSIEGKESDYPRAITESIIKSIDNYSRGVDFEDDVTLLCVSLSL